MSSDDYVVQNIYKYTRKTYKDGNGPQNTYTAARDGEIGRDTADNVRGTGPPGCSCDLDSEGIMANILHKKCPVIALAQQQLNRVLDETDRIFSEKPKRCRSITDLILFLKDSISDENKGRCKVIIVLVLSFIMGLIFGAASCGTDLRTFNSPVLMCIENYFALDNDNRDDFNGIL